jgi:transposase IS116/IS110/IS902 family protein
VLAGRSRRDLAPAIWLPDFEVRQERERARWRLHLVKHRSMLKQRVHSALMCFGHACPVSDRFGTAGRELLARLDFPDPWRSDVPAAVALIDDLDRQITAIERELRRLGADHPYVRLLETVPGIAWVLGSTIAAEIGDITRFPSPTTLCGSTGLCPKLRQSGSIDRRGPLTHDRPQGEPARIELRHRTETPIRPDHPAQDAIERSAPLEPHNTPAAREHRRTPTEPDNPPSFIEREERRVGPAARRTDRPLAGGASAE